MSLFRPNIPEHARSAIIQYALFRWENAVLVAGTILLTAFWPLVFPWWPIWLWPLLGIVGLGVLVYSSLTNTQANAEVLLRLSQAQFDPRQIRDVTLRSQIENALAYQRRIEAQVRRPHDGVLWDRPEDTANQLHDWIANVYQLAVRLDAYWRDDMVKRELDAVPKELAQLTARRQKETSPAFQQELDSVLDSKRKQWEALQALDTRMKQVELQVTQSLAALATVDSQVQLLEAQDINSHRSETLRTDIREQVNRLNDLVTSLNTVYESRPQLQ